MPDTTRTYTSDVLSAQIQPWKSAQVARDYLEEDGW